MKYFSHCTTLDQIKAVYKQLARENHPDMGGDTATMQAINAEYETAIAGLIRQANFSQEEAEQETKLSQLYREVVEQIAHLKNITIELVGNWIWVTGETYPVRRELAAAGLSFASKKLAWYFRTEEYKVSRGGRKSLDQIRAKYGSQQITSSNIEKAIH